MEDRNAAFGSRRTQPAGLTSHASSVIAHLSTLNPQPSTLNPQPSNFNLQVAGRDPAWRCRYLERALDAIPRLLGAIDRNPYRKTYGCLDRQFWHYRTASFPSEMYQEGVLPLALVYATKLPGNRWFGDSRVKELAVAAMHFSAAAGHADGSCDDYYPFERALGAAVFSLAAATRAYQVLGLDDAQLVRWFQRRAHWLVANDESGRLANHQALAALGLLRVSQITGKESFRRAAEERIDRVLDWQNEEGWFEEYGGADPGYQTVTIDCLAKIRRAARKGSGFGVQGRELLTLNPQLSTRLDESLRRAVDFASLFLHPDHSYGGPYGSRGTCHFYPHGMELLAADNAKAAALADGFLAGLAAGTIARLDDDRMFAHRLGNLIEAYLDWCPETRGQGTGDMGQAPRARGELLRFLPQAGILVRRVGGGHTVISAARGGTFVHFSPGRLHQEATSDTGLIVETTDGRVAVSHCHDRTRPTELAGGGKLSLSVSGPLCWVRSQTATPWKQALFHAGMCTVGRWCRTAVRRLLQRRLITGRQECPIRLTRRFEFLPDGQSEARLRVTDTIELLGKKDRRGSGVRVRRMAFASDHESAYVAAGNVYQPSTFTAWTDLTSYVDPLNAQRKVTVVREL